MFCIKEDFPNRYVGKPQSNADRCKERERDKIKKSLEIDPTYKRTIGRKLGQWSPAKKDDDFCKQQTTTHRTAHIHTTQKESQTLFFTPFESTTLGVKLVFQPLSYSHPQ